MKRPIDPRSRTRNRQVRRIIQTVALMQRGYWSVPGLARRLKVSTRTASRDLAALQYDGLRLTHDGIKSAWRLHRPKPKAEAAPPQAGRGGTR